MITRYSDAYDELFLKANERLAKYGITNTDGSAIQIASLEEYFSHLADLLQGTEEHPIPEDDKESGYIFLKLPLDEPYFEIDANTRIINVPDAFKKNGCAAIKGDEVAEILFFEVDRFFDATDLSIMDISIQWEHSSDASKKGYTPAFIRDIESNEDKLIFGWPITSAVTELADNLKFAVRFYRFDPSGEHLEFSLTTQPATLKIVDSLNLNMKIEPDDATELILGRLYNSPVGTLGEASTPIFEFYNPNNTNLDQIINDTVLAVLASKRDGGTLSYAWYHNSNPNSPIEGYNFMSPGLANGQYVIVNQAISNIATYYYKDGSNYVKVIADDETFEELKAEHGDLYALCATYTLTHDNVKPGEYYVDALNTFYSSRAYAIENAAPGALLPRWRVAGPVQPEIATNLNSEYAFETDSSVTLSIGMKTGTVISNAVAEENNTIYKWYKNDSEATKPATPIATTAMASCSVNEQGYYMVEISNTKNNETKTIDSNIVPVYSPIRDFTVSTSSSGTTARADLSRELELPFEEVTFTWRLANSDQDLVSDTTTNKYSQITGEAGKTYTVIATVSKGSTLSKTSNTVTVVLS